MVVTVHCGNDRNVVQMFYEESQGSTGYSIKKLVIHFCFLRGLLSTTSPQPSHGQDEGFTSMRLYRDLTLVLSRLVVPYEKTRLS